MVVALLVLELPRERNFYGLLPDPNSVAAEVRREKGKGK